MFNDNAYVVVNFYFELNFIFALFLCMLMYGNKGKLKFDKRQKIISNEKTKLILIILDCKCLLICFDVHKDNMVFYFRAVNKGR